MESINCLSVRAKVAIIVISIFLVSLTMGLLVFGTDITEEDNLHINSMHQVTSDMIFTNQHAGEGE